MQSMELMEKVGTRCIASLPAGICATGGVVERFHHFVDFRALNL